MKKIAIIIPIWHRDKFYFTCISGPWYLITVPNMKKIDPAIIEECVRTDRLTNKLDSFFYTISLLKINCIFLGVSLTMSPDCI